MGSKKLWGLVGNSKIGSYSVAPRIWRDLFRVKNLQVEYFILGGDLSSEISSGMQEYLNNPNFIGANIALPWKYLGYELCDYAEHSASHMDAINTIIKRNHRIEGHNTDGIGMLNSIKKFMSIQDKKILLLGCGSSSQTVPFHLFNERAERIYVHDIIESRAKRLARKYSHQAEESGAEIIPVTASEISDIMQEIDILINTTPCGMKRYKQKYPISVGDIDSLNKNCLLVEAVYNPYETPLLRRAKNNGNTICPGVNMLVEQAAESFYLAFGERLTTVEKQLMENSAKEELRKMNTSKSHILENKLFQKILPESEDSDYKITICKNKIISLEKDIVEQVDNDWKEFSKENPVAQDNISFFSLGDRNDPPEDTVIGGSFKYIQSFSRTASFEDYPVLEKGLVPLSSLCLIETNDNQFIFGIKKNMDMKISGFSGYLQEEDIDWSSGKARIFEYLSRTLKNELNLNMQDIKSIHRIGKTYSPDPLDEAGLLNNRAKNNIFWVKTNLSSKELIEKFNENSQFNKLVSCRDSELFQFLEDNYEKMSVHCVGGLYNLFCTHKINIFKKFPKKVYDEIIFEKRKTILITGASGFIGEYISEKFNKDYDIIGLDIKENNKSFFKKFYLSNICDSEKLKKIFMENKINYVIHTAAEKHLVWCEENKEAAEKSNFIATKDLYNLSKESEAKFIFISSDQVFDGNSGDYSEESEKSPVNYYGILKNKCEEFLQGDSSVAICRTAMVFGKIPESQKKFFEEIKQKDYLVVQGYIVDHVKHRLENSERIILPKDEFCNPTSKRVLYQQLKSILENNLGGIFHCCGGEKISRYDFGVKIARLFNLNSALLDPKPSEDPLRPKDVSIKTKKSEEALRIEFPGINNMICEEWNLK